jgi:hypothetical protein
MIAIMQRSRWLKAAGIWVLAVVGMITFLEGREAFDQHKPVQHILTNPDYLWKVRDVGTSLASRAIVAEQAHFMNGINVFSDFLNVVVRIGFVAVGLGLWFEKWWAGIGYALIYGFLFLCAFLPGFLPDPRVASPLSLTNVVAVIGQWLLCWTAPLLLVFSGARFRKRSKNRPA